VEAEPVRGDSENFTLEAKMTLTAKTPSKHERKTGTLSRWRRKACPRCTEGSLFLECDPYRFWLKEYVCLACGHRERV